MYRITNIYVLAAFGTIGGALFGFDVSSMSAWIGIDTYTDYFDHPDSNLQGGITASMSAGSFAGSIAAGWLSDYLGRRGSLMVASLVWIIGAMVQCSAQNVTHLVAGRVVSGLAVGVTSSQTCVYLSELAPARIRGRIVGIQQWAIEWGILIMYLIAYGCSVGVSGTAAFRICWGVQAVPGLILFIALFFFPESPRWLAGKERWEEALETLALIHGNGNRNDPVVQVEFEEVQEAARVAHQAKDVSFFALFGPRIWKRTICGMSVQMWQQLLGGNVAMYYVVYIFEMAGMTGNTTLWSSAIQYVIFLVTTGVMLPYIDRVGRRPLLLIGSVTCMVIHFIIAGVMASRGHSVTNIDGNYNLTWEIKGSSGMAVIAFSYIFTGVYGFTWAPTAWIYASEVFPLKYRAKGVGMSASANWIFNFALAYFVAPAFHNIQWKTYIIFAVVSLEEIDMIFDSNVMPWRTNKIHNQFTEHVEKQKEVNEITGKDAEGATHEEVV
ncbi:High-affinity glucose transporter [Penicillium citrinum]|uniref:High-affinity glucose transporter n=1 Tax=Penicillium citrinum TaxID=5077 RepID=A0A9W9NIV8_PENCI|nr:High-affinity glucose transporter [Penicillium citrinum]KAJ5220646.1 High-affinity glucose transporter [Penicillium citrinum]